MTTPVASARGFVVFRASRAAVLVFSPHLRQGSGVLLPFGTLWTVPMPNPGRPFSWAGLLMRLVLLLALILAARHTSDWVLAHLPGALAEGAHPLRHGLVWGAMLAYVVLLMIPFVPGVEIGLGLMMALGAGIAPLIYLCTVLALTLAFLIGRCLPETRVIALLSRLRLTRMADLLRRLQPLDTEARLAILTRSSRPRLLSCRFVILAVALNLPGNFVIGGGGGISLIAGFCRLFSLHGFVLTVALAVAPVPVAIFLFG